MRSLYKIWLLYFPLFVYFLEYTLCDWHPYLCLRCLCKFGDELPFWNIRRSPFTCGASLQPVIPPRPRDHSQGPLGTRQVSGEGRCSRNVSEPKPERMSRWVCVLMEYQSTIWNPDSPRTWGHTALAISDQYLTPSSQTEQVERRL